MSVDTASRHPLPLCKGERVGKNSLFKKKKKSKEFTWVGCELLATISFSNKILPQVPGPEG